MDIIFKLENIKKSFNNKLILNDVNMKIDEGKIVSILGINGAGKTTLFKIIVNLLIADSGYIYIDKLEQNEDLVLYKKCIGYLPDDYDSFLNLTGNEYLNFICDIYKISESERRKKIEDLSKILGLSNELNKLIGSYSKGMKQKIKFIGTIIHTPQILILDEPFNGLDIESVFSVKNILLEFSKNGGIVIFSTHILEVAMSLSDNIFILNKGKIEFNYNTKDKKQINLEKKFLEIINEGKIDVN